jgi:multiple sugar transport system substrate-binding protein
MNKILVFIFSSLTFLSATAIQAVDLNAQSGETVFFRGWQYRTDIVQSNIDRYNNEMGGNVDYATVTGDYPAIMEQSLMSGGELDIFYANPSQASRYYDGGWVKPANELPNYDEIKADMYPAMLDAWSYKGDLLGLSYFVSTRGTMHLNLQKLKEIGMTESEMPANWDELYDSLYIMRDKGLKYPYLPHWFSEWYGISWGFVMEVMNRGGLLADGDSHKAMLTSDGAGGETLRDWKRAWNDGLIPEEVLTYNESAFLEGFKSGEYLISPQQIYDLAAFNDPANSKIAGHVSLLPYKGQSWGILDSAVYVMSKRDRSDALEKDVERMASWYGHKDQKGNPFVGANWLNVSMLFSGYKSVMESPEAKATIQNALARPEDYETVLEVYKNTPYPKGVWSVTWAPVFNSWLKETLMEFLQEDGSVEGTIDAINDKISELNDEYGIG